MASWGAEQVIGSCCPQVSTIFSIHSTMELAHWTHFALSSQEHGRGRICEYWALSGVLVFRLVVERPSQGAVKPSIVTRSGSQFDIFCSAFDISAQMDVVVAGRL